MQANLDALREAEARRSNSRRSTPDFDATWDIEMIAAEVWEDARRGDDD
jgi:hypothetical protein